MSYQSEGSETNEATEAVLFSAFFTLLYSRHGLKIIPDRDESRHVKFILQMFKINNTYNNTIIGEMVEEARKIDDEFKSVFEY